jgi:hypothetical protein
MMFIEKLFEKGQPAKVPGTGQKISGRSERRLARPRHFCGPHRRSTLTFQTVSEAAVLPTAAMNAIPRTYSPALSMGTNVIPTNNQ